MNDEVQKTQEYIQKCIEKVCEGSATKEEVEMVKDYIAVTEEMLEMLESSVVHAQNNT